MLTFREACERLRISPKTLRKHIKAGELKASRVGAAGMGGAGAYRFTEEAIADFLAARAEVAS